MRTHSLTALSLVLGCTGTFDASGEEAPTPSEVVDRPPGAPRPVEELRDLSPFRRLTRTEYQRTVEAAFGGSIPTVELPPDQKIEGYTAQSTDAVNDQALTTYLTAAADLADHFITEGLAADCADRCPEAVIESAAPVLFRRPLAGGEASELRRIYDVALAEPDTTADEAMHALLTRLLLAPDFLYKVELDRPENEVEPGRFLLSDVELAARLSYFLHQGPPDGALAAAAAAGELSDPAGVEAQARRLLAEPAARQMLALFHAEWLHLDRIGRVPHPMSTYPTYTPDLVERMTEETSRFVTHVVFDGSGSFETLLTGRFSFMDDSLGEHYGMTGAAGMGEPTPYPADFPRAGVLGHASFLAAHAKETDSKLNTIFRGLIVREQFLCGVMGAPPEGATEEPVQDRLSDPRCAGCHQRTEPIGQAFENFNSIGVFRDEVDGEPVDARGVIADTEESDGSFEGIEQLGRHLAGSPEVHRCYTEQWLRYAMGRPAGNLDDATLASAYEAFAPALDIRELLVALVTGDAFRSRYQPVMSPACEESP